MRLELSLPIHAVWCWVNPEGHLQVKPPMVFTQRNWQLCCLVEHSSRSGCQNVTLFINHYLYSWTLHAATQICVCSEAMQKGKLTFAGLSIWLQNVPSGARAQVTALCVLTQEVTWLGRLRAFVQIWNTTESINQDTHQEHKVITVYLTVLLFVLDQST